MSNNKQSSVEWLLYEISLTLEGCENSSIPHYKLMELGKQAKEMCQKQMIDFALYHSTIMKYALQNDCEFYAKQNYKLWLQGESKESYEQRIDYIESKKYMDNLINKESIKFLKKEFPHLLNDSTQGGNK